MILRYKAGSACMLNTFKSSGRAVMAVDEVDH